MATESAPFAQALRNLHALTPGNHAGPVLRIGGNSADDSCFVAQGAPPPPAALCRYNITAAVDLAAYRTFAARTARDANVSFVIDVNITITRQDDNASCNVHDIDVRDGSTNDNCHEPRPTATTTRTAMS